MKHSHAGGADTCSNNNPNYPINTIIHQSPNDPAPTGFGEFIPNEPVPVSTNFHQQQQQQPIFASFAAAPRDNQTDTSCTNPATMGQFEQYYHQNNSSGPGSGEGEGSGQQRRASITSKYIQPHQLAPASLPSSPPTGRRAANTNTGFHPPPLLRRQSSGGGSGGGTVKTKADHWIQQNSTTGQAQKKGAPWSGALKGSRTKVLAAAREEGIIVDSGTLRPIQQTPLQHQVRRSQDEEIEVPQAVLQNPVYSQSGAAKRSSQGAIAALANGGGGGGGGGVMIATQQSSGGQEKENTREPQMAISKVMMQVYPSGQPSQAPSAPQQQQQKQHHMVIQQNPPTTRIQNQHQVQPAMVLQHQHHHQQQQHPAHQPPVKPGQMAEHRQLVHQPTAAMHNQQQQLQNQVMQLQQQQQQAYPQQVQGTPAMQQLHQPMQYQHHQQQQPQPAMLQKHVPPLQTLPHQQQHQQPPQQTQQQAAAPPPQALQQQQPQHYLQHQQLTASQNMKQTQVIPAVQNQQYHQPQPPQTVHQQPPPQAHVLQHQKPSFLQHQAQQQQPQSLHTQQHHHSKHLQSNPPQQQQQLSHHRPQYLPLVQPPSSQSSQPPAQSQQAPPHNWVSQLKSTAAAAPTPPHQPLSIQPPSQSAPWAKKEWKSVQSPRSEVQPSSFPPAAPRTTTTDQHHHHHVPHQQQHQQQLQDDGTGSEAFATPPTSPTKKNAPAAAAGWSQVQSTTTPTTPAAAHAVSASGLFHRKSTPGPGGPVFQNWKPPTPTGSTPSTPQQEHVNLIGAAAQQHQQPVAPAVKAPSQKGKTPPPVMPKPKLQLAQGGGAQPQQTGQQWMQQGQTGSIIMQPSAPVQSTQAQQLTQPQQQQQQQPPWKRGGHQWPPTGPPSDFTTNEVDESKNWTLAKPQQNEIKNRLEHTLVARKSGEGAGASAGVKPQHQFGNEEESEKGSSSAPWVQLGRCLSPVDGASAENGEHLLKPSMIKAIQPKYTPEQLKTMDMTVPKAIKSISTAELLAQYQAAWDDADTPVVPEVVRCGLPEHKRPTEADNDTDVEKCIQRIKDNDPTLVEVNLNNMKRTPIPQLQRLIAAIKENTNMKKLSLANLGLFDSALEVLLELLETNETIEVLNIETNFLTGNFLVRLFQSALVLQTLREVKAVNQSATFSNVQEQEMMKAIYKNRALVKVSLNLRLTETRARVEKALIRNGEMRRLQRKLEAEGLDFQEYMKQNISKQDGEILYA